MKSDTTVVRVRILIGVSLISGSKWWFESAIALSEYCFGRIGSDNLLSVEVVDIHGPRPIGLRGLH